MPATLAEAAEAELRLLAERRAVLEASREELAADIVRAVAAAANAGVSMSQVARLLRLDRSTLYRTYLNGKHPL